MSEKTRKELASLSFEEKVKILEKLRERDRLIAPERERLRAKRLQEQSELDKK